MKAGRLTVSAWHGGPWPWARWDTCSHHLNLRVGALGRRVGFYWRRVDRVGHLRLDVHELGLRRALRLWRVMAAHDLDRRVVEPVRHRLLRLLPRPVVYWVLIRAGGLDRGIRTDEVVPEVPFVTVLERWGR